MATGSVAPPLVGLVLLYLRVRLSESTGARDSGLLWLQSGLILSTRVKVGWQVSVDDDVLLPYAHIHGPSHSHRHVRDCLSVANGKTTYETWPPSSHNGLPVAESTVFISDLSDSPGRSRWVYGHMTVVHDPLRTLSVLEPGGPGGCEKSHRVTVEETAKAAGCLYAQNAGFFNITSDACLGNVVSDGRMVRDSGGVQNAQFGIRKDGSLVFGYLAQEDVLDEFNPFVQLVSGVVWLLRNGEVYINQSLKAECDKITDQVVFREFVEMQSARTVVGHDVKGNVVLFHVDGRSKERGMNLWEVAEFLKKNEVINAVNLDGGGSSSFVVNGTLASYTADQCKSDSRWRCARPVSTVLCVHERRCEPSDCSGHGDCVDGHCQCHGGWQGAACDSLVCQSPACGSHGVCTAGYYGDRCKHTCACFNGALCNHVNGRCTCPPGFYGNSCEEGSYGLSCAEECQCEDQCPCDPVTGSCAADRGLNQAGQCLARLMFTTQKQQEEDCRENPYLSEQTWLIITSVLASLLLGRLAVHAMRASRKWILSSYFYTQVPQREINAEAMPVSLFQLH
ncbi:N-acetylglucosamine-1-phosphodiester alpha-N-acetylglucosaminidase-like protein [Lates japonicus]|uniref:N-acetylglucosamine-1-phosphodiester alpha-N-acetylglucosaminidase-like protein n=1 Tax=Lates japonicus TaxID=270547 RepID=A0AAD3MFJ6_LATJO|nr:N-acetylglucosamine-1-phosphodiester alpha-N-acetylglucosaminidase-like protein [Lates japonicus]